MTALYDAVPDPGHRAWSDHDGDQLAAFKPPAWWAHAECSGLDPNLFFPARGESTRAAKEVCAACPVRDICLEDALNRGEKFGIRGGKSEYERKRIRRQLGLRLPPHPVDPAIGPSATPAAARKRASRQRQAS